jgi:hypothetical protein
MVTPRDAICIMAAMGIPSTLVRRIGVVALLAIGAGVATYLVDRGGRPSSPEAIARATISAATAVDVPRLDELDGLDVDRLFTCTGHPDGLGAELQLERLIAARTWADVDVDIEEVAVGDVKTYAKGASFPDPSCVARVDVDIVVVRVVAMVTPPGGAPTRRTVDVALTGVRGRWHLTAIERGPVHVGITS